MPGQSGFGTYLKAAFFNRWNLLFLVGGVATAFMAPYTDAVFALVAAAEISLVTAMATSERFQRAFDSRVDEQQETKASEQLRVRFNQLFYGLDTIAQARFNELRARCEVLREVRSGMSNDEGATRFDKMADLQVSGVNRLLWVYLKLLYTRATLQQFFKATHEQDIKNLIDVTRQRLEALPTEDTGSDIAEKKRRSLEDTLQTATSRWDNWKRAKDNAEYVELELDRIAAKLTALSELAINRQDPDRITTEVDLVTESVQSTEQTMSELHEITGFTAEDLVAPPILSRGAQRSRVRM